MYSRKSWGGAMDPFILTKFIKPKNLKNKDDPLVSLVVFEWSDKDLIGYPLDDNVEGSVSRAISEELLHNRKADEAYSGHTSATNRAGRLASATSWAPLSFPKMRRKSRHPK
jgi:hypothetical protein